MKAMLPDGRVCGVYNDYPRFFDDSFVFVGAERSAKVMTNVTSMISGQNAYTQNIYPFQTITMKIASAPAEPPKPAARIPDVVVEERLTRVLDMIPASTGLEREALRFFMQERMAEERLLTGTLSASELEMWREISTRTFRRKYGLEPKQISHLKQLFNDRANEALGTKTASFSKVAEMLKRIPAPSASQMSLVRKEEMCLPELPVDLLDQMAQNPGPNLRAAAQLGVVLRPREFQRVIMVRKNPALADSLHSANKVFAPSPVDMSSPAFDPSYVPRDVMESVAQALAPMLESRSFAPAAIRVRMIKEASYPEVQQPTYVGGLEELSDLYNSYRLGIIERKPDLSQVQVPQTFADRLDTDVKMAEDSSTLSNVLLHVAYWPSLTLGLGQQAEGSAPEDAP
jgi:hypothetical protein